MVRATAGPECQEVIPSNKCHRNGTIHPLPPAKHGSHLSAEHSLCITIPLKSQTARKVAAPPCPGADTVNCPLAELPPLLPAGLPTLTLVLYNLASTCSSESSFENVSLALSLLYSKSSSVPTPVTQGEWSLVVSVLTSCHPHPCPPASQFASPRLSQACTCPRAFAPASPNAWSLLSRFPAC